MSFLKSKVFKHINPQDPRLGNFLLEDLSEADYVVIGYPDDEGIKNNGGRIGASEGPQGIRNIFYKTTPHQSFDVPKLFDAGDLEPNFPLEERHEIAKSQALQILQQEKRLITLGGGHDYGYPDGWAFLEAFTKDERPLIINFDAHLDVRPLEEKISSGTPFYRLLQEFHDRFDFIEIGLQQVCNAKNHYEWAQARGMKAIWLEDLQASQKRLVDFFIEKFESLLLKKPKVFLSIDIDVFSSAYAPGASQSWPYGLEPKDFFPLFRLLCDRLDVKVLSIYEVSPPLDENFKTQRLAAQILHRFLYSY